MMDEPESHPSYGAIAVGRVSGKSHLFGSEALHHNFIRVTISRADTRRGLAQDWFHPVEELIEVYMSEAQWAHFISSMNLGRGSQCTLVYVNGERMPEPPRPAPKTEKFRGDVRNHMAEILDDIAAIEGKVAAGSGKRSTTEILHMLGVLRSHLLTTFPFIADQFNESMEETMLNALQEMEGYFANRIQALGLDRASEQAPLTHPQLGD